jgi:aminoglycoside phosphotransferase (APT) family kinase protein
VLGIDSDGREVLSFVPAEGEPRDDDEALAAVARLVRRYHDATVSFREPENAPWQYMVGAPREREVVCHNDLSPANTIYGPEGPHAFVDWDLAAPGPRLWDVAYAVWRFVPLYPDDDCRRLGFPVLPRGPRIRLFCDAYGLEDRGELLETVRRRQQALYDTAREWGGAGAPGWADVWRDTRGEQWLGSQRYLEAHRSEWERELG